MVRTATTVLIFPSQCRVANLRTAPQWLHEIDAWVFVRGFGLEVYKTHDANPTLAAHHHQQENAVYANDFDQHTVDNLYHHRYANARPPQAFPAVRWLAAPTARPGRSLAGRA